jgi:succinyl-diaminopimelate desuccinylase
MSTIDSVPSEALPLGRKTVRENLSGSISDHNDEMIRIGQELIRVPSENPSGDTAAIAELSVDILSKIDGAEVELITGRVPFTNVIARIKGARPGRRMVLNGHLDTFPVGDRSLWTVDPFGGEVIDGRLYGRGAADMKGGIAASMMAFRLMAQVRHAWSGELVLTLAADEETMGKWGSGHLLETIPYASGDALICGDAGSPRVIRFGEKGMVWLELSAIGRAAHGAHVHLGSNALDLLVQAIQRVQTLCQLPINTPDEVQSAIQRASSISEPLAGAGETEVLTAITVNLGYLQGGSSPNLVPSAAKAGLDIRLPVGTSAHDIARSIGDLLAPLAGVEHKIVVNHDPTYSDPDGELFQLLVKNGAETIGTTPVVNMRVGGSDTRLFRSKGISSAVYGCSPHNMGGPDEFATLDDLYAVFRVHALTAFDFLTADRSCL